ncbi:MAG: HAD family hydrolase [Flavobacteriaceae bacterium]|nr:HAD family hydrolase [Flavobacteriaceae bacterium]
MKYKCIIFDCDGILVDSELISNQVIVDLSNELGANITIEYAIKNYAGTSLGYITQDLEDRSQIKVPDSFRDQYRERTYEAFQNELKPIEGIKELLTSIKIPFCVASNGPLHKMRLNLTVTQLIDQLEGNLFSAYEIERWKPDPALFLHAASKMGFKANECAVIEDSLSGVKAAISGGFDVYGFTQAHNEEAFKKEGAIVFNKMNQLYELLE